MKTSIKIAGLFAAILLMQNSCSPDKDFSAGKPQDRISQLAGTWKLQTVVQTDLVAKNNNFIDPSRPEISLIQQDISAAASFTDMSITFVADANAPTTFTINYGNSPKIFKISAGDWKVDDVKTPGIIKMVSGTDTTTTVIGGVNNLSSNMLTLKLIKYQQSGKPATEYDYNFKKN